jgi:CMP/dCMP kinase
MNVPVLTIDGPGGAGKGTISVLIASRLGWHYLDSGAMYRVLGVAAMQEGVTGSDEESLVRIAESMEVAFQVGDPSEGIPIPTVWLNGHDASAAIRREEASAMSSEVAVHPGVRKALLARQQAFRRPPGLVADGRDMGTVVFPDATLKVFLTASAEERANRRYKQLIAKGIDVILCDLLRDIQARDERDTTRAASPLRPARDAILIDTTHMSIDQVVEKILDLLG